MDLEKYIVSPGASIREVMGVIDRNGAGAAVVTAPDRTLLGLVTDGDIRRGILARIDLETPIAALVEQKALPERQAALVMPAGTDRAKLIWTMRQHRLRHIPLVDPENHVVELAVLDRLIGGDAAETVAIVMAGGYGSRLGLLTAKMPKPMLAVGQRPLLQRTIERLGGAGIRDIYVSVHYKSEVIARHFGDGSAFGVNIAYIEEEAPLGTAGSIAFAAHRWRSMLVINGDVLTTIDIRAMLDFHRLQEAELTVALAPYEVEIPYGVVDLSGSSVARLVEKPKQRFLINTGIYWIEPAACDRVPRGRRYDMTELVQDLLAAGKPVAGFPLHEYWRDIGRPEDLAQATADIVRWDTARA